MEFLAENLEMGEWRSAGELVVGVLEFLAENWELEYWRNGVLSRIRLDGELE